MSKYNKNQRHQHDTIDEAELYGYNIKNVKRTKKKKVNRFKDERDYYEYEFNDRWWVTSMWRVVDS